MSLNKPKLLIVEDDEGIRTQLKYALRDDFVVATAGSRAEAMTAFQSVRPGLVTLDLGLPPSPDDADEGLKTLDEILQAASTTKVVVVTGNGDRRNAVAAVNLGAFDYLSKPVDVAAFKTVLQRAIYLQELEAEADRTAREQESVPRFEEIIGSTARL